MRTATGTSVHLRDYTPPSYLIDHVDLDFRLDLECTIVTATLDVRPNGESNVGTPLILDGDDLTLDFVAIDGKDLLPVAYKATPNRLEIPVMPRKACRLQITTRVNPTANTQLMGLYRSSGAYCTQCEAEGFRRITYFLDRPDVLATYRTRLEVSKRQASVLLANGNLIEKGAVEGTDRLYAIWEDPHPKPSYLFALVAGKLEGVFDTFTTMEGREVQLGIYVETGKTHLCDWAMESLKASMKWDEQAFGRVYDLDVFNIVAVSDFNMGAMENKGLNVFNDKYILADPDSATDQDYANIEAIIAHEYFHNWSGNRVTCRDWFQLCLKEGFTVFRDQEFSSDMRSRGVKRIADVRLLKSHQFPEDSGPLAHPVRPETYQEINNFYTATVYEKGAELVRMIHTLLGAEDFRKGCDLYFDRNDGTAATVEDFLAAFEDVSGRSLKQFAQWYKQAGTPEVIVEPAYDVEAQTYTLTFNQLIPLAQGGAETEPLHIPIRFALIGKNGTPVHYDTVTGVEVDDTVMHITDRTTKAVFHGVTEQPVPSLLRGFSAPVRLRIDLSEADLLHLVRYDDDSCNRWMAAQTLASQLCFAHISGNRFEPEAFASALNSVAMDESLEADFRAMMLTLPAEGTLAQELGEDIDPDAIFVARNALKHSIVSVCGSQFYTLYQNLTFNESYEPSAEQSGTRALQAAIIEYVAYHDEKGANLTFSHFENAQNMTDRISGLKALVHGGTDYASHALASFATRHGSNPLAMDKWLTIQATAPRTDALEQVRRLMKHPSFDITNPNRVRALVGAFAMGNQTQFNKKDGSGYRFVASLVLDIDKANPQLAARILTTFRSWRLLETVRRNKALAALKQISSQKNLSSDLNEIVNRMLNKA